MLQMRPIKRIFFLIALAYLLTGCEKDEPGSDGALTLVQVFVGTTAIDLSNAISHDLPVDRSIALVFSLPLNQNTAVNSIRLTSDGQEVDTDISFSTQNTVVIYPSGTLNTNTTYTIVISDQLQGANGESFTPVEISFKTVLGNLALISVKIGGTDIDGMERVTGVPQNLGMTMRFSAPVSEEALKEAVDLRGYDAPALAFSFSEDNRSVDITSAVPLKHITKYEFTVANALKGVGGEAFPGFARTLYTAIDETPKFPVVSDDALLTLVQQQTFKYFWDFAHPASGMARERNTSGDIVTSGGSGFGIMTLIVGMERNFITREEGLDRMDKILGFLETADRFHGAWSHWLNGNTGSVVPFSANDNGGDLVETSFLIQGLLTFRQYLREGDAAEQILIDRINVLWHAVEWDWYTRGGEDVLYWHWSPDKAWVMNHRISGYNEALITYFLAAASPAHPVAASVYHEGWAGNGNIANNKNFYNITLPLGYDYGGPLFFAHYSFLGLDPRNLNDLYANYWTQNKNHSLINHAYCVANPKNYVGYSDENWGLTASDNHAGYSAHSPTNDLGVITPTAALSSFPYTPDESMKALKFFYYTMGDRLWGPYGFYDAFNITEGWTADSYLAIDQGPIVVMIENYRSGLLWDLFMSAPEVQVTMDKLGFER